MYNEPIPTPPPVKKGGFWRGLARTIIVIAVLFAVFGGGLLAGLQLANRPLDLPQVILRQPQSVQMFNEVHDILLRSALKPSSETSMGAGGVQGLLKSLDDPYAAYFDPAAYKAFQEETNGQFFGIGITISIKDGKPIVVEPLKGTPADKAGLKPGDAIVSVNGVTKAKWTSDEIVGKIRGPEGTKVTLGILHKGQKNSVIVTITRAKIQTPNVTSELVGSNIGYVRLFTFNAQAAGEVKNAIDDLQAKGAKGFIIDLRENPGGLLDAGVDVSSLFVKSGPIVRVDTRTGPEKVYPATGNYLTDKPLVLLVDANSASAAEIMSGALQDYGRATIVGEKTYGKGSVQTIADLTEGGAIKFTIAHYLTPKKRVIDRKGVQPDFVVKMDPSQQADHKTDTQFQKAVEVLKGKLAK